MNYLHSDKIKELEVKSDEIRKLMTGNLFAVEQECTTCSLGVVDFLTLLYFHVLKHDPKDPEWKERDRLILSSDHICLALYATMAHAGYFPVEKLKTLRKFGSRPQDYPTRAFLPGIKKNSGLLGSLSQAVGMTIADRMDHKRSRDKFFYCLLGDKELQEDQNWEAISLAGREQLHNLVAIIGRNNIQTGGLKENTIPFEPVVDKFEEFNWHVLNASINDFDDMDNAIGQAQSVFAKPTVIFVQ
ncbi:MAG: transketolase [Candidatus Pacebacteria bacterium]|nr:transketolase [Candidatus Paceibacterota bacterium]